VNEIFKTSARGIEETKKKYKRVGALIRFWGQRRGKLDETNKIKGKLCRNLVKI
jgi:hypothetical protein